MSPTVADIKAMAIAISGCSGHEESWREWKKEARAAWLVAEAKVESDLSSASEEMVELMDALDQIVHLRPCGPTKNKLVEQMERIALVALRSSRTKGE
jgi:PBP1b-binding outer membrane lipoprotein LpoB